MSQPQPDPLVSVRAYFVRPASRGKSTDAVTDGLREAILEGVLPPGTWLREDELAATFEVSRTPVREAVRRLADEGLLLKTAHQGTLVATMSLEDILALYVVREELDGFASRIAAVRRPTGLVERLEGLQEDMINSASAGDQRLMSQQNLDFHRSLREASNNSYLQRFLTQVEQAVRRLEGTTLSQPGRAQEVIAEHAALIEAIRNGDGQTAEAVARAHMRRARELRISMLLGT